MALTCDVSQACIGNDHYATIRQVKRPEPKSKCGKLLEALHQAIRFLHTRPSQLGFSFDEADVMDQTMMMMTGTIHVENNSTIQLFLSTRFG